MTTHQLTDTSTCSLRSRQNVEDPIGSAVAHRTYVFAEVPLPWEDQVERSRKLPPDLKAALERCTDQVQPFRFLAFCSDTDPAPEGRMRMFRFRRPELPCTQFNKLEYIVPFEQCAALAEAMVGEDEAALAPFEPYRQASDHVRELFVCTHGSHDMCCGKWGYPAYRDIVERYQTNPAANVRAWRTSHFGGHRHAPTLIDMPEGRYWAQMTADKLDVLIRRDGDISTLYRNYRGWGAFGKIEQIAEREAFMSVGWRWIHYEKRAEIVRTEAEATHVRIDYRSLDGSDAGSFEAKVQVAGEIIAGGCGVEPFAVPQYAVTDWRRMP